MSNCVRTGCFHAVESHAAGVGACIHPGCTCTAFAATREAYVPSTAALSGRKLFMDSEERNRPPFETFKGPTCKGSILLGSACGHCEKCVWEREHMTRPSKFATAEVVGPWGAKKHEVTIAGDHRISAVCSCGWQGEVRTGTKAVHHAELDRDEHLELMGAADSIADLPAIPQRHQFDQEQPWFELTYRRDQLRAMQTEVETLKTEVARLQSMHDQVDSVLTSEWISVVENDWVGALHRLVHQNIQEYLDPAISQDARNLETLLNLVHERLERHDSSVPLWVAYKNVMEDRERNQVRSVTASEIITLRDHREARVLRWMLDCFPEDEVRSLPQRGLRLTEEAAEAAQAAGTPKDLGGVGVTALALAAIAKLSADECEIREVHRIINKPREHFAARNKAKNDEGLTVMPQSGV